MKLWEYIKEKMMEHPNQTVCENDASMTYEEICIYAESRAKTLRFPCYAILCHSEMATAMSLLACIAAGKTAIPLPTRYGVEYYSKLLQTADPPGLITDQFGKLETYLYSEEDFKSDLEETAVILFTSGSTGVPKGVMLSETNLISNIDSIESYFPIGNDDTILIARPLYHSSVLTGEFLLSLCSGAKIVFSSEPFQPLNILTLMKKHQVTVFGSTPTLMATFARFVRNREDIPIRLLSVSGECMTDGMARSIRKGFPNAQVYCGYGLSEASPRVAYLPQNMFDICPAVTGVPVCGVNIRIVDPSGNVITDPDRIGEVLVSGPNIMQGYFNDQERTKKVLENDWLHTGDLAYWDQAGFLCVKGRKDDMIIRAGMNVYPVEIENIVSKDPRVRDVLVYGFQRNDTQEIGMKISGDFNSVQEVIDLCHSVLPQFQIPFKIELIKDTEVLSGGKKKRKKMLNDDAVDKDCKEGGESL